MLQKNVFAKSFSPPVQQGTQLTLLFNFLGTAAPPKESKKKSMGKRGEKEEGGKIPDPPHDLFLKTHLFN